MLRILMLTIALFSASDLAAQSAEPDSIFLLDGGVLVVQITGLDGGNVRIIAAGGQTQDLPLSGIVKIADARGRIIYWQNKVSAKAFSQYMNRSGSGIRRQGMLEVGATLDNRSEVGGSQDFEGNKGWTQFTPRIGWAFSSGFTIELSGGKRKIVSSPRFQAKRKFIQVHFVGEFLSRKDKLTPYSSIGVGSHWSDEGASESSYFNNVKGFTFDAGFGLKFPVSQRYHINAEARFEFWFRSFGAWAIAIGVSRRIPL